MSHMIVAVLVALFSVSAIAADMSRLTIIAPDGHVLTIEEKQILQKVLEDCDSYASMAAPQLHLFATLGDPIAKDALNKLKADCAIQELARIQNRKKPSTEK